MPNHYHLLVRAEVDNLAVGMHGLAVSFSKSINRRQGRVGPLFQGRFRSKLVAKDEYLLHLSRYVHLNPVAAGLVAKAEDWPYSSYLEYIGLRNGTLPSPGIVLCQLVPPGAPLLHGPRAYKSFLEAEQAEGLVNKGLLFEEWPAPGNYPASAASGRSAAALPARSASPNGMSANKAPVHPITP